MKTDPDLDTSILVKFQIPGMKQESLKPSGGKQKSRIKVGHPQNIKNQSKISLQEYWVTKQNKTKNMVTKGEGLGTEGEGDSGAI